MRNIKRALIAGGIAVAAVGAVAMGGTAQADPPSGTVPRHFDITGVGAQTDDQLFNDIASDYDATQAASSAQLYSYDAAGTATIKAKSGCAAITRPNGANAGITALEANAHPSSDAAHYCIDYARGSRPRATTDPSSIVFIPFAIDSVSWASDSQPGKNTHAPANLTTTQLKAIYSCDASVLGTDENGPVTWDEVGGKGTNAVVPVVPPSTAATRTFFLSEIGVSTLGSCVKGQDNSVEQNEGTDPIFSGSNSADIVFPYSTAVFLAQTVHNHGAGDQGYEKLGQVDGIKPISGSGSNSKINLNFEYVRNIYNVVRNASTSGRAVPSYLTKLFGDGTQGSGYICKNKTARASITSYGFLFDSADCGLLQ